MKKKFTLIEMLVVISIISILAAILMPALRKSVLSARSINCKNNLKQVSVGIGSYENDYYGTIPYIYDAHYVWYKQHQFKYPVSPVPTYLGYSEMSNSDFMDAQASTVFNCPSASPTTSSGGNKNAGDYCGNANVMALYVGGSYMKTAGYVRVTSIKRPSGIIIVGEATDITYSPYFDEAGSLLDGGVFGNYRIGWVHEGISNMLFVDGHVAGQTFEQTPHSMLVP